MWWLNYMPLLFYSFWKRISSDSIFLFQLTSSWHFGCHLLLSIVTSTQTVALFGIIGYQRARSRSWWWNVYTGNAMLASGLSLSTYHILLSMCSYLAGTCHSLFLGLSRRQRLTFIHYLSFIFPTLPISLLLTDQLK